ncbi:MAG: hydroxymethylbilane synthase [Desulfobacterales bacterium]|nr:hydroxymethylbilane synthase [Desulfobacterales bacterium]
MPEPVVIGTRGSPLALWQAEWVRTALKRHFPATPVELKIIKTQGDKILDVPLAKVGGKGLFVKEIEEALMDGRVDLAVHSMKDMPAEVPEGLAIGAVPEREDPSDVLISRGGRPLAALPLGSRIGTSSLRRAAQLLHHRPDLIIVPLRGNLDTRLRKLDTDALEAVVLAAAGVRRLGLAQRISEHLDAELMLPAVGQGALCIEIRRADTRIAPMAAALDHPAARAAVTGERAFLRRLEGGCQVPIAGYATVAAGRIRITGLVADVDGSAVIRHCLSGPAEAAELLGIELAEVLLGRGAKRLLSKLTATLS